MPDAVVKVGPRCTARGAGVEETNRTHERSAESKCRLWCTLVRTIALSELDAIVVMNKAPDKPGSRSVCLHNHTLSHCIQ